MVATSSQICYTNLKNSAHSDTTEDKEISAITTAKNEVDAVKSLMDTIKLAFRLSKNKEEREIVYAIVEDIIKATPKNIGKNNLNITHVIPKDHKLSGNIFANVVWYEVVSSEKDLICICRSDNYFNKELPKTAQNLLSWAKDCASMQVSSYFTQPNFEEKYSVVDEKKQEHQVQSNDTTRHIANTRPIHRLRNAVKTVQTAISKAKDDEPNAMGYNRINNPRLKNPTNHTDEHAMAFLKFEIVTDQHGKTTKKYVDGSLISNPDNVLKNKKEEGHFKELHGKDNYAVRLKLKYPDKKWDNTCNRDLSKFIKKNAPHFITSEQVTPDYILAKNGGIPISKLNEFPELSKFLPLINELRILHSNGIIHRDIKPDNVCYDANTKTLSIIDCDFAISLENPLSAYYMGCPEYTPANCCNQSKYGVLNDEYAMVMTMLQINKRINWMIIRPKIYQFAEDYIIPQYQQRFLDLMLDTSNCLKKYKQHISLFRMMKKDSKNV